MHSGAGRISTIQMRPMTLYESADSTGEISLKALFQNELFEPFMVGFDLVHLIDITVRGGWPETLALPVEKSGNVAIEYINAIVRSDNFHDKHLKRNQVKLRRLIKSLARNNATTVAIKTLSLDTNGSDRTNQSEEEIMISRNTVVEYIKDLREIYFIDEIPPWNPEIRSKTVMRQTPKRVFADPSLAIASLSVTRERLLQDLKTFGFMFENLCLRDLTVYANYYGGNVFHYRDNSGLEVDVIIEMPDGAWGAFEIKLGAEKIDSAADTLLRMKDKMVAAGADPPSCLVVVTGGGIARVREDGVYVAPINALCH
jgi:hypothetical protein